ncbi:hypothetical protein [Amnibacterium kyonggiense]|nr:hypothetical protein [Amnibacterium kyonggiense]
MQGTMTPRPQSTLSGATPVWDLSTVSQRRYTPRVRPSRTAPAAAGFGLAALGSATVLPAAPETRWFLVVALGLVAVLVGVAALRRRQTRRGLLLAIVGVLAPAIAVAAVAVQAAQAPATVTSSTVQRATLQPDSNALVPTPGFTTLAGERQVAMRDFLSATVLQLQTMHGSWAPLPTALAVSNGALVERDGVFQGTALGAVPESDRVTYQVSSDGTAFRLSVSSATDPRATIWADRALQLSTSG